MNPTESVFWLNAEHELIERDELKKWLEQRLPWVGTPAYLVHQTIQKARFVKLPTGVLAEMDPKATFAGRIFGLEAELRWALHGGKFDVWSIREANPAVNEHLRPLYREEVHYYCLGQWDPNPDPDKSRYREGHIPGELKYPVAGSSKGDRFRVEVYEYLPAPELGTIKPDEIAKALNRPRIVAARLYAVGSGRTTEK